MHAMRGVRVVPYSRHLQTHAHACVCVLERGGDAVLSWQIILSGEVREGQMGSGQRRGAIFLQSYCRGQRKEHFNRMIVDFVEHPDQAL